MDIQTRLRQAARYTRLDADKELLTEAADVLDIREGVIKLLERDLLNQPAPILPTLPAGYVTVPLQVLRDAADALGNFIMDHGWGDSDMQAMDNLDAYIARHSALTSAQAQKGGECLPIRGNQVTCSRGTGGCGIQHKGGD